MYIFLKWETGRIELLFCTDGVWTLKAVFLEGNWVRKGYDVRDPSLFPEWEVEAVEAVRRWDSVPKRVRKGSRVYRWSRIDPEEAAMILFQIKD